MESARSFFRQKAKSNNPVALLAAGLVAAFLTGASIGLELYVVLPLILLPAYFVAALSVVDTERWLGYLRYAGVLTVAAMILWPRYSYIRVGGLPGVTPPRLLALSFAFIFFAVMAKSRRIRGDFFGAIGESGVVGGLMFVYLLFRVLSVVFADEPLLSLFATVNELIFFGLFFALSVWFVRSRLEVNQLSRLLAVATVLVALVAVLEYKRQQNIFAGILPVSDDYAAHALANKVRDSGYRAQGTFDHPLTFAQYMVAMVPLLLVSLFRSSGLWAKLLWGACCSSALVSVVLSGSRSAFVAMLVSLAFLGFALLLRDFVAKRTTIRGVLVAISGLVVLVLVAAALSDKVQLLLVGRTTAEASSSAARLYMMHRAIPLVMDSPLYGYGVGRAAELIGYAGSGGVLTVDSLPLSIAVDSGVFALVSLFLVIASAIWRAFRAMAIGEERFPLSAGFAAGLVAFGVSTMTLSLTSNLFILALLLSGALACARKRDSK